MTNRYASTRIAIAVCDRCGFVYRRKNLREEIVKGAKTNVQVCQECWDPDHPQLHLGERPIDDPQAIMNPRPDVTQYPQSRAQVVPLVAVTGTGWVGQLTVTT